MTLIWHAILKFLLASLSLLNRQALERAEIEHHQRRRLVQDMLQRTSGAAANADEYFNVEHS